jgi:hypothetical protein
MRGRLIPLAVATAALLAPADAPAQGGGCLQADPPPLDEPAHRLRFGTTPQLAGTVGGAQGEVAPEDPAAALVALERLQPPRRTLVIRLNRLFMSDGRAGIRRFVKLARRYSRAGFAVESQVRYHPTAAQEGRMGLWRRFVRRATAALARNPALVALTITNEVNLPISENTSDGGYERALDAITLGIPAAQRALRRSHRGDVDLGFSYAWRYLPDSDADFWSGIGERATPRFLRATDYVGVQLYPGLFWPPAPIPGRTAGDETLEALTLVRDCYMPMAQLGGGVELWVTENGYTTGLGRSEASQVTDLTATVEDVHEYSGTLNVTDYRYFNLRDNRANGTDLFDNVGLLRPDYSRKPAFGTQKELIRRLGA